MQTQSRLLNQDAMTMVAEIGDAIAEASSQIVAYGYETPVIVMLKHRSEIRQRQSGGSSAPKASALA